MLSSLRGLERLVALNTPGSLLKSGFKLIAPVAPTNFHTCSTKFAKFGEEKGTRTWNLQNEKVFPPESPVSRVSCG